MLHALLFSDILTVFVRFLIWKKDDWFCAPSFFWLRHLLIFHSQIAAVASSLRLYGFFSDTTRHSLQRIGLLLHSPYGIVQPTSSSYSFHVQSVSFMLTLLQKNLSFPTFLIVVARLTPCLCICRHGLAAHHVLLNYFNRKIHPMNIKKYIA